MKRVIYLLSFLSLICSRLARFYDIGEGEEGITKITPEEEITFSFNVTEYNYLEEGVIAFYIPKETTFEVFASEVVCKKEERESKIPTKEEEGTFKITNSSYFDYKLLFFRKSSALTDEAYILIRLKFEGAFPDRMTAVASKDNIYTEVFAKGTSMSFRLSNFVPKIAKYGIEKTIDDEDAFVFSSSSTVMTGYNGNFLSEDLNVTRKKVNNSRIFVADFSGYRVRRKNISILFFGEVNETEPQGKGFTDINHSVDKTNARFSLHFGEKRKQGKTYSFQQINPYKPLYFIGQYNNPEEKNSLIYIESLSEGITSYYQTSFPSSWNEISSVLPGPETGRKVSGHVFKSRSDTDLIGIYCKSSCLFNIHFIPYSLYTKNTGIFGEPLYAYVNSTKTTFYYPVPPINETIYIEIVTISGKEITYSIPDKNISGSLGFYERKYRGSIDSDKKISIEVSAKYEENAFVRVVAKKKNNCKELNGEEDNFAELKDKHCGFIRVPKSKQNFLTRIGIRRSTTYKRKRFTYSIQKTTDNYILLPIEYPVDEETFILHFLNPYYNQIKNIDPKEDNYYVVINFEDTNGEIEIKPSKNSIEKHTLKSNTTKLISKPGKFMLEQSPDTYKQLVIVATKCSPNNYTSIQTGFYNKVTQRKTLQKQFTFLQLDTKEMRLFVQFSDSEGEFSPVMFYYVYATPNEIKLFKDNIVKDFSIRVEPSKDTKNRVRLSWLSPLKKLKESVKIEYKIFKGKIEGDNYKKMNVCLTEPIPDLNITSDSNKDVEQIIPIDTSIKQYVYITAQPKGGISPKFSYSPVPIQSNSSKSFDKTNVLWILAIIIIVILIFFFGFLFLKIKQNSKNVIKEETINYTPLTDNIS